jgi:integrase/recombinase XerD
MARTLAQAGPIRSPAPNPDEDLAVSQNSQNAKLTACFGGKMEPMARQIPPNFTSQTERAKLVSAFSRLVRQHRLTYEQFAVICRAVRKEMELVRPRRSRRLPKLLPEASLKAFYNAVDQSGNLQHQIMLRLLFYTAVRVSELASIAVDDVDIEARKIFISAGKGDKDRYILFPDSFALILKAHLAAHSDNRYLFESRHCKQYSARRIQQIVKYYAEKAGITEQVHPHLFRHQMLTWLTAQGLPDSAIQLISGHSSKKSLEVYQHLSLADVQQQYRDVTKALTL